MTQEQVTFTVTLDTNLASALAQFVKRLSLSDLMAKSSGTDETIDMKLAIYELQKSLREAGYDPR